MGNFSQISLFLSGTIYVVVISEHEYNKDTRKSKLYANSVSGNIGRQLNALSKGQYLDFSESGDSDRKTHLLSTNNISIYDRCLNLMDKGGVVSLGIPLLDLDSTLRSLIAETNCIVDVTALKKNLLIDVTATLISLGFSDIYSFELKKKPTHGQEDLYHQLRMTDDFIYRNLTESEPVRQSLKRITSWSIRRNRALPFSAVLLIIIFAVNIFWRNETAITIINSLATIATITSFALLFER